MTKDKNDKVPDKWKQAEKEKSVKAMQVAFELEQDIAMRIKERAARNNLNPSDQIRKMLDLTYSPPKRPRLTVSLKPEDYDILGERFGVDPKDQLEIRRKIIEFLIEEA